MNNREIAKDILGIPPGLGNYTEQDATKINAIVKALDDKDAMIKAYREALENLLDGINYSSAEVLNGKYSRNLQDEDQAYILGAHTFFKLIGKSYPNANKIVAQFREENLK